MIPNDEYRGFRLKDTGRSYIGERPIPEQHAVYRLAARTLAELKDKIDDWIWDDSMGLLAPR